MREFFFQSDRKLAIARALQLFFYKMPHFIKQDGFVFVRDLPGRRRRRNVGKLLRLGTNPVQNRDIADAEDFPDAAKAHAADRVHRQRHVLHRGRLASRRSIGEVHPAGFAQITLVAAHDAILAQIGPAATLARNVRNVRHDSPRFPVETVL